MKFSRWSVAFTLLLLGLCTGLQAQLEVRPLPNGQQLSQARTAETEIDSTQHQLPFWDDFSTTDYQPDPARWFFSSSSPHVSEGIAVAPPTVNVVSFDGWNFYGEPHNAQSLAEGSADSLVSRFIDLSQVAAAERGSVFMSFFWQKQGLGEQPDAPDSLRLQFKMADNTWRTVWSVSGPEVSNTESFVQEILPVVGDEYFHPYFQFRFQSFGRLSGGYDGWNIDYVYLNKGRHAADLAYEDRALTSKPTSFLTNYTAMPYRHFLHSINTNITQPQAGFYNLDDVVQPIELYSLIRDSANVYDRMDEGTVLDPNPQGFERRIITTRPIDAAAFPSEQPADLALVLETKMYINSGDTINFGSIDYRHNDTVSTFTRLADELAYDDGQAEWAAGLSAEAGQLAYRYVVPEDENVTALNIYFPDFEAGQSGQTFTIIIWDRLTPGVEGRLLVEQHIVKPTSRLNDFKTYTLGRSVAVSDTFYIGFRQEVSGFFPVGLDKNTNSADAIYYNFGGAWERNNQVTGSLMMRPVFGEKRLVTGLEDADSNEVTIYPNPTTGRVHVRGNYDRLVVQDLLGRQVMEVAGSSMTERVIDLSGQETGIYLVRIYIGDSSIVRRLLISR